MFKYIFVALVIILAPALVKANYIKKSPLSGTWFLYGFVLYQPIDRTVTSSGNNQQKIYEEGFNFGLGGGKDHLRVEYSQYMEKSRFIAAFDIFTDYIATPYIGYAYTRGLKAKDSSGLLRDAVMRSDAVLGITFQPSKFINIYAEYLMRDSFFFAGARFRLPYIVK